MLNSSIYIYSNLRGGVIFGWRLQINALTADLLILSILQILLKFPQPHTEAPYIILE